MRYPALLRRRDAGSFCFPTEGSCGKHYLLYFVAAYAGFVRDIWKE